MSATLLTSSYSAPIAGAKNAAPDIQYKQNGYTLKWDDNLMSGLPPAVAQDLRCGAGQELEEKVCAAYSSSALVANTFGPWRVRPNGLRIADLTGFDSLALEVKCPTGLQGTPPHLDVVADGKLPVAVESKCTEWMTDKRSRVA